ncbi:MAG: ribonuclease III [Holosporaceae bacterium]|jgi:ribonuclease-3|nr:ribonuclease III [Holosporaceae bacterium]
MVTPESVKKLQNIIGYEFKNIDLIAIALIHPGLRKKSCNCSKDFERLEFLGDRVLGLALADFLYKKFPSEDEGGLARKIAIWGGTDFLIDLAKKIKIIDCFSMPKDFFISINKNSASIADMMEAILGSIFLDSDFKRVMEIVVKLWENNINEAEVEEKDPKSRLQEMTQSKVQGLPSYSMIKMMGVAHDPIFEVEAKACGETTTGYGISKRNAECDAAAKLIKKLEKKI